MKIELELEDVVTLTKRNGEKIGGTIIGNDETGYIVKTGPKDNDIEAIERTRILSITAASGTVVFDPNESPELIDIPPAPGSMPPIYDSIAMKWHHPPDGACTCGCTGGGDSGSPNYLIS
ncbi:hypothetical protein SB759_14655 [Pseudomonas sp. SIMBA_059]